MAQLIANHDPIYVVSTISGNQEEMQSYLVDFW